MSEYFPALIVSHLLVFSIGVALGAGVAGWLIEDRASRRKDNQSIDDLLLSPRRDGDDDRP